MRGKNLLYSKVPMKSPVKTIPQTRKVGKLSLTTAEEILENIEALNIPTRSNCGFANTKKIRVITQTDDFYAKPSMKEYSGSIGVRETNGVYQWVGVTSHGRYRTGQSSGKIQYEGPSLDAACNAVNKKLAEKEKGKGSSASQYVCMSSYNRIYKDDVIKKARAFL